MCVLFYVVISRIMKKITRAAVSRLQSNCVSVADLRVTIAFDSRGCSLGSVCSTPIIPDCRCASIRSEALHPSSSHTTLWRLTSSLTPRCDGLYGLLATGPLIGRWQHLSGHPHLSTHDPLRRHLLLLLLLLRRPPLRPPDAVGAE